MSALSPAPAPTLGVRWADLPSPLDFALPICCLSYKQSALLPPLCFQPLTASFACPKKVNSLRIKQIQPLFRKRPGWGWRLPCLATRHSSLATSLCSLGVDPMLDMRLEEAQRHGALLQDGIVEGAYVELGPKAALSFDAQLANLELAEFVGQRLPRPDDVAIDFDGDVLIRLAGVVLEKLDGLLARPAHRMHARVHHQAHRAPHFVAELPEFRVRISVEPDIFAKPLAVQRPAFDKSGIARVLAKLRRILHLLRQRNLQMVPGNRLMQRECFHFPLGPRVQIVRVDEEAARPPRLRRAALIIRRGLRRRFE